MVRVLIAMRRSVLLHSAGSTSTAWLIVGLALGVLTAGGTLALGIVRYQRPGAGADVLALVLALWIAGRAATAAFSGGDPALSPEFFRLLPLSRRRLAGGLLVVGMLDPGLVLYAIAFGALVALGAHSGPAAAAVGIVAAVLSLVFAAVLGTVAGAALGSGSRRGRDLGTVIVAVAISAISVTGTLLPSLKAVLSARRSPALTAVVRILPSGWGPDAVDAAGRSDWPQVLLALAGLVAITAATAAAWPVLLRRRLEGAASPAHPLRRRPAGRRILPATPTGAVAAKEVRLWFRDPIRLTCLIIAVLVGTMVCVIPRVSAGTTALMPFGGLLTVIIAGACAGNLYGVDGTALWLTVLAPGSAAADVRGRQAAWLLVVAPYTVAITVLLTAVSGQRWAWPWVLSGLPALLGGAAGILTVASLVSVQPLDDSGGITPAWSLKVHALLPVIAVSALPPGLLLLAGTVTGSDALRWAAVPVGLAVGVLAAWGLGRSAGRRLAGRQVGVLSLLRSAETVG